MECTAQGMTRLLRHLLTAALILVGVRASAQNHVGINVHVANNGVVDLVSETGAHWIRVDANWFQMEPSRGTYHWFQDDGVREAIAAGIDVYMTIAYTPEWVPKVARARTDTYTGNDEPVGSAEWVSFVEACVTHYRAMGVTHFGLWNEPNLDHFWDGNLDAYLDKIAIPGAAAVRRVCDDCRTLGPDLAHVGDADDDLATVMRGKDAFDIFAHHIYNDWPENGHTVFDGDSFLNALEMRRFGFTRDSLRAILDRHGWTGEVWITETGYRATPIGSASEEGKQATYVRRVLEEQLARDWWTNSFFYEIADCGIDIAGCDIDGFGITRPTRGAPRTATDYIRKPAFNTLRDFIATHEFGDAPPPMPDAGMPDAGGLDAGVDMPDAAMPDAGGSDAGVETDAGGSDAGEAPFDGGATVDASTGSRDSSGGCSAGGPVALSPLWLLLLLGRRRQDA